MQHLRKSPWALPDWAVRPHPFGMKLAYADIARIRVRLRRIRRDFVGGRIE
jgi:hypothetical protein